MKKGLLGSECGRYRTRGELYIRKRTEEGDDAVDDKAIEQ